MPKQISLYSKPAPLNWNVVAELPSWLGKIGLDVKSQVLSIRRYPISIEYEKIKELIEDVQVNGEPKTYNLVFRDSGFGKGCTLTRLFNIRDQEILSLSLDGCGTVEDVRSLASFLNLEIDSIQPRKNDLERKCFVAHRFDDANIELADKLARFLNLLNFDVSTGRGFSPSSVSEKVKARMDKQAIVFAIFTAGDDATWLTQESLLASLSKPLFLLKEKDYAFKPGLLGDHEYIPFTSPAIETTFIPILEGIRELGFKF